MDPMAGPVTQEDLWDPMDSPQTLWVDSAPMAGPWEAPAMGGQLGPMVYP